MESQGGVSSPCGSQMCSQWGWSYHEEAGRTPNLSFVTPLNRNTVLECGSAAAGGTSSGLGRLFALSLPLSLSIAHARPHSARGGWQGVRVGPHLTGWCGMGLLVLATPKSCALTMFSLVPFWSPAGLSRMQPLPSPDAWGHPQPLCPCSKPREGPDPTPPQRGWSGGTTTLSCPLGKGLPVLRHQAGGVSGWLNWLCNSSHVDLLWLL